MFWLVMVAQDSFVVVFISINFFTCLYQSNWKMAYNMYMYIPDGPSLFFGMILHPTYIDL